METFWLRFDRFCSSFVAPGNDLLVTPLGDDLLDDGRYDNRGISGGSEDSGSGSCLDLFLDMLIVDSVSERCKKTD